MRWPLLELEAEAQARAIRGHMGEHKNRASGADVDGSGEVTRVDRERLDQFSDRLRRTVVATCIIALQLTLGPWVVVALPAGVDDGWNWSAEALPSLPPGAAFSVLAVVIVVLAAVALAAGEPASRTDHPDIVELRKDQIARDIAQISGAIAGVVAVWGVIGSIRDIPEVGLGEGVASAISSLALGAVLVTLGAIIFVKEPRRLRRLADLRHAEAQGRFASGLARWSGSLPALEVWSVASFRRRWSLQVLVGLAWQVALMVVVFTALGATVVAQPPWTDAFLRNVWVVARVGAVLTVIVVVTVAFLGYATLTTGRWPRVLRRLACVGSGILGAGVVVLEAIVFGATWAWVCVAPTAAFLLRVLVPLALKRRVPGVSTSALGAFVDHRFWVLLYFQQTSALPRSISKEPESLGTPIAAEPAEPDASRESPTHRPRLTVTLSIDAPRRRSVEDS